MRRRGILAGVWALSTVAATAVAWIAVDQVTQQVAPPPVLPLPAAAAAAPVDGTGASAAPEATAAAPAPAPAAADGSTEAYDLVGGVVTVRYRDRGAMLAGATPSSGFDMDIRDRGPAKVEVRFRSDQHESRIIAGWGDDAPQVQREERPR